MDNFIVSARKYRPSTFNSVVGQSALTATLKNAIKNNHLAHAYLFCGPRGVGKTTCARIFAKTINCQHLTPDYEACNECESCVAFNEQRSYNIHELDAASNNGVDDIRNLIDQVRIPPQVGRYSVYIIDEVHMLSQGAFNAFLKTLEEPPAHAIFILATTEKHKIIPTILSRTQIYDFNRITIADTVAHLQYVARQEGVEADENALHVIAQKSDGGMRDALSIFDQIVSFSGNRITYQDVITNLNVLDYEYYFRLVEAFLAGDVSRSLLIFNEILEKGFEAQHFVTGLAAHLRDVLVCKDPQTVVLLEVGADIRERYKAQAAACPVDFLFQALKLANDCDLNYRISRNKRLLVELTLIRLCQLSPEKKKSLAPDDAPPALQPVTVASPPPASQLVVAPAQPAAAQPRPTQASPQPAPAPASASRPAPPPTAKREASSRPAPSPNPHRPVSISITKPAAPASAQGQQAQPDRPAVPDRDFSDEELRTAWHDFASHVPSEEKRLISYINTNEPVRIAGTSAFELRISNSMQERELNGYKHDLLAFLRSRLGNSQVDMRLRMEEVQEATKLLTPEDKYRHMATKNPALTKLRAELGFEID